MFRYPYDCPCAPTTRFYPRRDITVLMTDQTLLADSPVVEVQLPQVDTAFTAVVTALVDTEFAPVQTTAVYSTDSEGKATLALPQKTRYFKLEVQFQQGSQRVEAHCYSNVKAKDIWSDPADLVLRAALLRANRFAFDTSGIDHGPGSAAEQTGPCKAARALAIVHLSIFEAINSITPVTKSAYSVAPVAATASREAAIAQALHDTLLHLFPSQAARFTAELAADLATVADGSAKTEGISAGSAAAARVINRRKIDGSLLVATEETYDQYVTRVYGEDPIPLGDWTKDPISQFDVALGSRWATVKPFVLTSADQFRAPPPPEMDSQEFADNFSEVKAMGGDGVITSTVRSEDDTFTGVYWAYDGTPSLCAPPRMYNQIVSQLATDQGLSALDYARLLALANTGMADAAIAAWDSKYYYRLWRPVTGIRNIGSNNPYVVADPAWTPLGAPNSNSGGVDFTPPFPTYVSGHATFGGAVFQILRHFLGGDDIPFTFVSDEYDGLTTDSEGVARALKPRSFVNLSQAEEENGQSRIYLGIHWSCDKTAAVTMGNSVGDWVLDHLYKV